MDKTSPPYKSNASCSPVHSENSTTSKESSEQGSSEEEAVEYSRYGYSLLPDDTGAIPNIQASPPSQPKEDTEDLPRLENVRFREREPIQSARLSQDESVSISQENMKVIREIMSTITVPDHCVPDA